MKDPLSIEKAFLLAHLSRLAGEHPGKYLLIKGEAVHGAFETFEQGVLAGVGKFPASPFLVRSVLRPEDPKPVNIPALSLGIPLVARSEPQA